MVEYSSKGYPYAINAPFEMGIPGAVGHVVRWRGIGFPTSEAAKANARLIAAAPDMLEALQAVKPLMIPGMNWTDETGELIKRMVRTAILKATGQESAS